MRTSFVIAALTAMTTNAINVDGLEDTDSSAININLCLADGTCVMNQGEARNSQEC